MGDLSPTIMENTFRRLGKLNWAEVECDPKIWATFKEKAIEGLQSWKLGNKQPATKQGVLASVEEFKRDRIETAASLLVDCFKTAYPKDIITKNAHKMGPSAEWPDRFLKIEKGDQEEVHNLLEKAGNLVLNQEDTDKMPAMIKLMETATNVVSINTFKGWWIIWWITIIMTQIEPTLGMKSHLSSIEPKFKKVGDYMNHEGLTMTLHGDKKKGHLLLSVKMTKAEAVFGYQTHHFDFEHAGKIEKGLLTLKTDLKNAPEESKWWLEEPRGVADTLKRSCKCDLSLEPWKRNETILNKDEGWIINHLETLPFDCTKNQADAERELFEVITESPAMDGFGNLQCIIRPTPYLHASYLTGLGQLDFKTQREWTNAQKKYPCMSRGSFNINEIPNERILVSGETMGLTECQLHCHFNPQCSHWIIHSDTPTRCWTLKLGGELFTYWRPVTKDGPIYSGTKECVSCSFKRAISFVINGRWKPAKEICTFEPHNQNPRRLMCPCESQLTYAKLKEDITRVSLKAKANNIKNRKPVGNGTKITKQLPQIFGGELATAPDYSKLMAILFKGGAVSQATVQALKWSHPNLQEGLNRLEPVARMVTAFGTTGRTTTRVKSAKTMRRSEAPTSMSELQIEITPKVSTFQAKTNFTKFFNKKLHRSEEIKTVLKQMENYLTEAELMKEFFFENPQAMANFEEKARSQEGELSDEANVLIMTNDDGRGITKAAVYPITKTSTTTEIALVPLPTKLSHDYRRPPFPEGTIQLDASGFMRPASTSTGTLCAMELSEQRAWIENCLEEKPYVEYQNIVIIPIQTNSTIMRLVKLSRPTQQTGMLRIICNDGPRFMPLKGLTTLLLGPSCALRDLEGNLMLAALTKNEDQSGFLVLYNEALEVDMKDWKLEAIPQWTITSVLSLVVAILAFDRLWEKRRQFLKRKTSETTLKPSTPQENRFWETRQTIKQRQRTQKRHDGATPPSAKEENDLYQALCKADK